MNNLTKGEIMMVSVFIEKVEFNKEEIKREPVNSIDVKFIVNGHEGTATVTYDENLKLKQISDVNIQGMENDGQIKSLAMHFLGRALQDRFKQKLKRLGRLGRSY